MRRALIACLLIVVAGCGGRVPEDASGEQIYASVCARCHGAELQGGVGPALVGDAVPSLEQPESYFTQTISRGKGRMQSFSGVLTDAQVQLVVDFILAEQGR